MRKYLLLYLIPLLFIANTVQAQFEILQDVGGAGAPLRANPYPEVKGTPYLSDFASGSIIFNQKDTANAIPIRYNAYGHMLEFKSSGVIRGLSAKDIKGFIILENGKQQIFRSGYDIPNLNEKVFSEVLVDGKYILLNYSYKILASDPSAAYGSSSAKMFQTKNDLFIVKDDTVIPFKSKKKNLQQIFGDDYESAIKIINSQNLDLRDEKAVSTLINLVNSKN